MLHFKSIKKGLDLTFDDDEMVQLCHYCSTPNKVDSGYCIDCGRILQQARQNSNTSLITKANQVVKCPECGHYNVADAEICTNRDCNHNFFANNPIEEQSPPTDKTSLYVKICPRCQFENPVSAQNCERCNEDLSFVMETEKMNSTKTVLFNLVTHQVVLLCQDEYKTIGRNGYLSDQLSECSYVGREHADIFFEDGQWFIQDKSRNGTYLKGSRIEKGVNVELKPGDIISFGDPSINQPLAAHFRFDCYDN